MKKPFENLSLQDIEGEVWKDIEYFEGYYQISNFGRVKSLERKCRIKKGYERVVKEKILKQYLSNGTKGKIKRLIITFNCKELNCKKVFGIARLVIKAFSKEKSLGRDVYHKNYKYFDNRIDNLFYGNSENKSNIVSNSLKNEKRTSVYKGVHKRMRYKKIKYIMSININKHTIKKECKSELKGAKLYDFYIKKHNLKREGNFINKKGN